MHPINCKLLSKLKTFEQGHIAEVELTKGSIPNMIAYADQIVCNETTIQLPVYLIKTNEEGICRLFINTSINNGEYLSISEGDFFEINISEYSHFKIPERCKKMLLLMEEAALFDNLVIIDFLSFNGVEANVYVKAGEQGELLGYLQHYHNINLITSLDNFKLQTIFNNQVIGTRLYISGSWSMINFVKNVAYNSGFTDDEIQYNGLGQKKEKIMCVKCYAFNTNQTGDEIEEMICEHCNTKLEVSSHYSRRLGAYLGYVKAEEAVIGVERRKK
ncbi:dimethylamine monooxygenase subunit DmmA family protein [Oceanobacillus damuensis]|uniref:dimethylamine monooxygenase subunit DmmA family protein n=1 Tax=Oceanobacillus damuensis TaxID=937928 RepID=UPI0008354981|nr:dimethylamine monooxygenase subunit DmmA family protein [Oceanobacillus damuensis]